MCLLCTNKPLSSMQDVMRLLQPELSQFEQKFKAAVETRVPLLDKILRYIINRKGKQMRPMFVLLSGKLFGPVNDATYRAASLVELLHTASLVHDDVVDEAYERRGFFSINALWKNKIAVLVGDYLLSKGLLLSVEHGDFEQLRILSNAVKKMSEGELLQMEKSRRLNLDEDVYYEIIRNKTASLLASACGAGAFSTTGNKELTEKMMAFGEMAGIAFQLKDDLFDYGAYDTGKPKGNDIQEKKLTLPLIYTINKLGRQGSAEIIRTVKHRNKDKKAVAAVLQKVIDEGGVAYAMQKMLTYRDMALQLLYEFPQSAERDGLEQLVRYTTDRKK